MWALRALDNTNRKNMKRILLLLTILMAASCASTSTQHRPDSYYSNQETKDSSDLFGNSVELPDKDIERILNYRLELPAQNRVAILKLSKDTYWRYYSNDFTQLTDSIAKDFIGKLTTSDRVYDASFLPSMLVPEKRTVPFLREAAARYQADLLLVYRSSCQTYEKYKFIDPNESKAYCSVEAALLDVRKGIVPFTIVSTNDFLAIKQNSDTNFHETKKKAELSAVSKSLSEVADQLILFLAKMGQK